MYAQEQIKPYTDKEEKAGQVERMFDNIAPHYDLLNHALSLGIDRIWRRKAIDALHQFKPRHILDVATGTGDFALLAAKRLHPDNITGCDISEKMMQVARKKAASFNRLHAKGEQAASDMLTVNDQQNVTNRQTLNHRQTAFAFKREDCECLSFGNDAFDAVTVAYGIRNVAHLDTCLSELYRVLSPNGHLLIIELTAPHRQPMKWLFHLYSHIFMPFVGWIVSGDKKAYTYLPATIEAFPQGERMQGILQKANFRNVTFKRFTFGLCTMYLAEK